MDHDHISRFNEVSREHTEDLNRNLALAGGDSAFFYKAKIARIQQRLKSPPRLILDYGCGVGTLTAMLSEAFPSARVVGFDPAEKGIQVANEKLGHSPERLAFESGRAPSVSDADLVVAAGVFHHIAWNDKQASMDLLFRTLRPGGNLFVFEHNPISPLTRVIVSRAKMDEGATLIYHWQMRRMMRKAGFGATSTTFISFFPPFCGPLLRLEPYLGWLPVSAQYLSVGEKR